jgi:CRP-like cAMP-binding protein
MEFRNFLLSALNVDDEIALVPHLKEVSLSRGQMLYEPGDRVELIYFPSSACISVVTIMQDGRAFETGTIGRESAAGLVDAIAGAAVASRVFVQLAGGAMSISAAAFRGRLATSPSLMRLALLHLRAIIRQAETTAACNVAHPADQRLARWLLMTEDRVGGASFPLTQEYMSVMTGVQRTTVSTMAAALKKDGIIDYSRGNIVVLDQPRLKAKACECYGEAERQFLQLRAETA